MNPRLERIEAEITKMRDKISTYTSRLRELERQKTELENAGIIALVRDMDILPDELSAFILAFKQKSSDGAAVTPPLPDAPTEPQGGESTQNEQEDKDE